MKMTETAAPAAVPGAIAPGRTNLRGNAFLSILVAIIFILTFTPIGFINLVVIKATIIHVPVIIGSVLLGPKRGAVLGGAFGAASLLINSTAPSVLSFAFSPLMPVPGLDRGSLWALLVCLVPRILVGVVPWYVCKGLDWFFDKMGNTGKGTETVSLTAAALAGSMTNTLLVMGLIYFLFQDAYAQIKGVTADAVTGIVLGVVAANGIPEAIFAIVMTAAICIPMRKVMKL